MGALAALVLVGGVILFSFGEDLFGSDPGAIDDYNRTVLESCDVPAGTTLVQTAVLPAIDRSGTAFRGMSFVYASPLAVAEIAAVYQLPGPDVERNVPRSLACRFGNRPSVTVSTIESATAEFWGGDDAEVISRRDVPDGTRSLIRLRLAQREADGAVG